VSAVQAREALEAAIWMAAATGTAEAVDAALAVADAYAEAAADDRIAGHVASREAGQARLLALAGELEAAGKPMGPRSSAGALLPPEDSRRVGAAVRALRLRAKVTQADVARAAGITQAMASQLELGRYRWRKRDAEAAARLLGTDLAGLLAWHLAAGIEGEEAVPAGRRAA
jgi:DNA-binding XRE family transcriptional regulator